MIFLENISKIFDINKEKVQALNNVSLHIEKGDIFGVIGFSGAGKSTLLRMINALETPTTGQVIVEGQDINSISHNELRKVRKNIGMIFQQFNLLNAKTVYDNVAIPLILNKVPKDKIKTRVQELLEFVDLADKADAFPPQLSGGQKQRVGIARALATEPHILLCDEATSALDPDTTDSILQLLERVNKEFNITILIVTHEINVIQKICNKVAVMEHGRVIESGTVLDVFSNPQQETTKRFVGTVIADKIPENYIPMLKAETRNHKILRLNFLGSNTKDNILYKITKNYEVETNVLFASVNELQDSVLGIFIVQVLGTNEEIAKVTSYLDNEKINWQEVNL